MTRSAEGQASHFTRLSAGDMFESRIGRAETWHDFC